MSRLFGNMRQVGIVVRDIVFDQVREAAIGCDGSDPIRWAWPTA